MTNQKTVFVVSALLAALAILGGGGLAVAYGFAPPPWLLRCEVAAFSVLALIGGFTAAGNAVLPWLRLRSVQGAMLVCLGVGAIFVPPNFIASAVFFALGIKLVWREACRLADEQRAAMATARPARLRHDAGMPAMRERGDRQPATLRSGKPSATGQRKE